MAILILAILIVALILVAIDIVKARGGVSFTAWAVLILAAVMVYEHLPG